MARLELDYLHCVTAKGRRYYYYRRGGQRIPLPNDPHTLKFMEAYQGVHDSFKEEPKEYIRQGSIAALIAEYKASADFKSLSTVSQRDYRMHLDQISIEFGKFTKEAMTRRVVQKYRDTLADKPATCNYRTSVMRRLFSFAVDRGMMQINPASKIKKLKIGMHQPWTHEQLEKFQETKSIGLLSGFFLALFTGQRQADVVKFPWTNIKGGKISVVQQKTGKPLLIPMHTQLKKYLDRLKVLQKKRLKELQHEQEERAKKGKKIKAIQASLTILMRNDGLPYKQDHFKHAFKDETTALGIKGVVFHGLRKNATHFLLKAGCTEHEVSSVTGMSPEMVRHYAKGIDQEILAENAIEKLEKRFKL